MPTVFLDIDTQIDFMFPAGALYVPGAEHLIPVIGGLNRSAAAQGLSVISTMCAHAENDPEFRDWPPHCVIGTAGQRKPSGTLVENQFFLEKQQIDAFSNPELPRLLGRLGAESCVVYGVVTEYCVRLAILGLLNLGKRVTLVTDATAALSAAEAEKTIREFTGRGGELATAGRYFL